MKLIRWGFVVHAAIDGYSRIVVFANISTDNKAATVLKYFRAAEQIHGKPSRLRCDFGGENIAVAEYMLRDRGINRGSVLTGPSNRNQRIERVWRDCSRSVIKLFSRIFTFLEERQRSLDYADPLCVVCLHYVFVPRIQHLLDQWVAAWNSHPIEGCGNQSPLQLREAGFLQRFGSASRHIREVFDGPLPADTSEDDYGVDAENDITEELQESCRHVTIPQLPSVLPLNRMEEIMRCLSSVNALENDENYGIDVYNKCLHVARSVP